MLMHVSTLHTSTPTCLEQWRAAISVRIGCLQHKHAVSLVRGVRGFGGTATLGNHRPISIIRLADPRIHAHRAFRSSTHCSSTAIQVSASRCSTVQEGERNEARRSSSNSKPSAHLQAFWKDSTHVRPMAMVSPTERIMVESSGLLPGNFSNVKRGILVMM